MCNHMQSVDWKSWITLTPSCPLPLFQVCTCIVSCGGEAAGWSTLLLRNLCWEGKQKEQHGQIKSLQEAHAGMVAAGCKDSSWSECWESHRIGIFFSVILGSASIVSSSSCTINWFQCLTHLCWRPQKCWAVTSASHRTLTTAKRSLSVESITTMMPSTSPQMEDVCNSKCPLCT